MEAGYQEWLNQLKVGDVVCYLARNYSFSTRYIPRYRKITITKITKTQICVGNIKFRKNGGTEIVSKHTAYGRELFPITPERKDLMVRERIYENIIMKMSRIDKLDWRGPTMEDLLALDEMMDKILKKGE
jgi:hypothetical protein